MNFPGADTAVLRLRRGRWQYAGLALLLASSASAAGAEASAIGQPPPTGRISGYQQMSRESRAMQDDDAANPATLWVLDGEALWSKKTGTAGRSCADCHGDARASMKGVAARHPAWDGRRARPVSLEQRINQCRSERQKAPALAFEGKDLLALSAYVGRQSRGLPIEIAEDARLRPFIEAGLAAFTRRQGQLNLACAQCHDVLQGRKLAGNTIPQAHPNGYPLYRLEWQGVGSLARRLRNCLIGTRSQLLEFGSDEMVDLELYLMWRARGMPMETPAVRP